MLGLIHYLIVFAQGRDVYALDFLAALDMCLTDLECIYVDLETSYDPRDFPQFYEYVDNLNCIIMMHEWVMDLNNNIEYFSFYIEEYTYPCSMIDKNGDKVTISRKVFF
jgi:hypothetical protein